MTAKIRDMFALRRQFVSTSMTSEEADERCDQSLKVSFCDSSARTKANRITSYSNHEIRSKGNFGLTFITLRQQVSKANFKGLHINRFCKKQIILNKFAQTFLETNSQNSLTLNAKHHSIRDFSEYNE